MIHSIMAPQARVCKFDLLITIFILIPSIRFCAPASIILPDKPFSDGQVLVSPKQHYALGFFRPGNSDRRYFGIWFNRVSEHTILWVANRDNPLNDTSGVVSFNKAGNLVLTSNTTTSSSSNMNSSVMSSPLWSTNVTLEEAANNNHNVSLMEARLLDSGNLVVVQKGSEKVLWQSFEHPTHTSIPFMRVGLDRRTGVNRVLTSWSSKDDPGTGAYTYGIDPTGVPQLVVYKGSNITWRAGPFNGLRWSGTPEMSSGIILNTTYTDNASEVTITYGPIVNGDAIFARLVIDDSGLVQGFTWQEADRTWFQFWSAPKDVCDSYRRCGAYSYCDPNPNWNSAEFECHCLPGFRPRAPRNWGLRDGSGGCVRSSGPNSVCRKGEGFVKFSQVKVPDTRVARVDRSLSVETCEHACLRNCTCMAYTSANVSGGGSGTGCLTWHGDLVDIKKYSVAGQGQDLYIRSDAVELANARKMNDSKGSNGFRGPKKIAVIAIAPTVFAAFLLLLCYCYWYGKLRRLRGDSQQGNHHTSLIKLFMSYKNKVNGTDSEESGKNINLTFFNLREIKTATANFSNKLGQGGFGPVYKGHMSNGQEIAVKRLSKHSGQGAEEFKNEVLLIAKLQHKNLVKLLGCCIEGTELMLIYEFMPNKSLDSFIFDETKRKLLDWPRRHEIIIGIGRGVLYLHQDSRLTIVHRDLKASNVLLDEEMNPKISDFGMARIFGGNQTHANTNRVVGTFGYMSPEYALDGLFSMKSDVFSFGVLLLEIISGTKNYALFSEDIRSNLIRHTWDLWTVDKALEIVDPSMAGSWQDVEVLRCIQVGLLCVQDEAAERPTMSTVVFMLSNETTLPFPKQPGFAIRKSTTRRGDSTSASTDPGSESCTKNKLTMTAVEPR